MLSSLVIADVVGVKPTRAQCAHQCQTLKIWFRDDENFYGTESIHFPENVNDLLFILVAICLTMISISKVMSHSLPTCLFVVTSLLMIPLESADSALACFSVVLILLLCVCVCSVPREQLLQTEEYDLNVVRLCIQVFLQDENGQYSRALNPIVTNPIYDNSEWPSCFVFWIKL